jgi:hypothetical protein
MIYKFTAIVPAGVPGNWGNTREIEMTFPATIGVWTEEMPGVAGATHRVHLPAPVTILNSAIQNTATIYPNDSIPWTTDTIPAKDIEYITG